MTTNFDNTNQPFFPHAQNGARHTVAVTLGQTQKTAMHARAQKTNMQCPTDRHCGASKDPLSSMEGPTKVKTPSQLETHPC